MLSNARIGILLVILVILSYGDACPNGKYFINGVCRPCRPPYGAMIGRRCRIVSSAAALAGTHGSGATSFGHGSASGVRIKNGRLTNVANAATNGGSASASSGSATIGNVHGNIHVGYGRHKPEVGNREPAITYVGQPRHTTIIRANKPNVTGYIKPITRY